MHAWENLLFSMHAQPVDARCFFTSPVVEETELNGGESVSGPARRRQRRARSKDEAGRLHKLNEKSNHLTKNSRHRARRGI